MYLITQIVVQVIETTYDTFVPKDSITVLYYHNMGDKQVQHKLGLPKIVERRCHNTHNGDVCQNPCITSTRNSIFGTKVLNCIPMSVPHIFIYILATHKDAGDIRIDATRAVTCS